MTAAALLAATGAFADKEAGNRPHVASDEGGQFYAKSVPADSYGTKGMTQVYQVQKEEDQPLYQYDWYAPEMYLAGYSGGPVVYMVQMGPWPRGRKPTAETLAIAFYKNGEALRSYSTLDIAERSESVSNSMSHYQVFGERLGFRRPFGNKMVFDIRDAGGQIMTFDADTGEIVTQEQEAAMGEKYEREGTHE